MPRDSIRLSLAFESRRNWQRRCSRAVLAIALVSLVLLIAAPKPVSAQTITYSTNTTLTGDVFCTNLTINPAVTLTTNGHNIYCTGTFTNNGTLITGLVNNGGTGANESPAPATGGGSLPNSIGGSGGGGGGSAALSLGPAQVAGTGGNTLASGGGGGAEVGGTCGTGGPGANGSTPSSPSLSNVLLQTWYGEGLSGLLAGAGGGGGAGSGFDCGDRGGSAGGSGAYGIYIQASRLVAGSIIAQGQPGGTFAGTGGSAGGGGGGGGSILLAYGSGGYQPGPYDTSGGDGGAGDLGPGTGGTGTSNGGNGGSGGTGQVLTFNGQPVSFTFTSSGACNGTVHLSASPAALTAGASSTITATVLFANGEVVPPGQMVTFSSNTGTLSAGTATTNTSGAASVTLTDALPGTVTVSATVSPACAAAQLTQSIDVVFGAQNWMGSPAFLVNLEATINLGQYWSVALTAYNALCDANPFCHGSQVDIASLPSANVYLIQPAASATPSQFAAALSDYFQINLKPPYQPVGVVILEIPVFQAADGLFNASISLLPLTLQDLVPSGILDETYIQPTSSGYVNLAFTASINSNVTQVAGDVVQFLFDLGGSLAGLNKKFPSGTATGPQCDSCKAGQATSGAVSTVLTLLGDLLKTTDLTINVVTTDLNKTGPLSGYTFFDLEDFYTAIQNGVVLETAVSKVLNLLADGVKGVADPISMAQAVVTAIDLGVEVIGYLDASQLMTDNLFQDFSMALGIATAIIDPNGVTILPTVEDSTGSLVLGYSAVDASMVYASPGGILLPAGAGFLALLAANPSNPQSYTEVLNGLGVGTVPYNVEVRSFNLTQPVQAYSGLLFGGSSVSIPIQFTSASGALQTESYLSPMVMVQQQNGSTLNVLATALLSNGTATTASNGFVVFNGQQYGMTQISPSTFQLGLNVSGVSLPTPFATYLVSPNTPGGFTDGLLGCGADVTSVVSIKRSGYTYNFGTGRFSQVVTLTNASGAPIVGPLSLVLDNLSSNASLNNGSGKTTCAAPFGSSYETMAVPSLAPGASLSVVLQFANPSRASIAYSTRVLAGIGVR